MKYPDEEKVSFNGPCSSRVDPAFVIKSIFEGGDGVFVAGCHRGGSVILSKGTTYSKKNSSPESVV
jgi:F420-non-reducing hydrogenase iron-sulfur subunit